MATELRAEELLAEARKMQRVPGIVFAEGTFGRVPRMAGTGIEVWEVIQVYRAMGRSWEALMETFDWLTPEQLRAALAYAEAYPNEIAERLERERAAEWRLGGPV